MTSVSHPNIVDTEQHLILLVDDEVDNLKTYRRILEGEGHCVMTARNRQETIRSLEHQIPDLVLLDVKLRNDTGFEVMKIIRQDERFRYVYLVLISASYTSLEDQIHGLSIGADGYLLKPMAQKEMIARIDVFLRHKRTLDQLRSSENRFRKIIFQNPDAIVILAEKGVILFANPAAERLLGNDGEELIGKEFGFPVITGEKAEIEVVARKGEQAIGEMQIIEIEWEDVKAYLTTIRDVTRRKRTETLLAHSEKVYRSLIKSIPLPLTVWRKKGDQIHFEDCNHAAGEYFKHTSIQAKKANPLKYYNGLSGIEEGIRHCFHFRKSFEGKIELGTAGSRSYRFLNVMYSYVSQDIMMVMIDDQTRQKQLEQGIRNERDQAARYLNIAASLILALDREGNITLLNDKGARMLGCENANIIGHNWFELFVEQKQRKSAATDFRHLMLGKNPVKEYNESDIITMDGRVKRVRWYNSLLKDEEGGISGILSSGEDITGQVEAIKKHKASELRFRELFSHMHNGVLVYEFDREINDFLIRDANHAALKMLGIDFRNIRNRPVKIVFPGIEDMGLWEVMQRVWESGKQETLAKTEYKDERIRLIAENSIYKLPSGEVVAVFSDVTKRVEADMELQKTMEEISKLTSRVIHVREDERKALSAYIHDDLGQLLTAIRMDLGWLDKKLSGEEAAIRDRIKAALSNIDHSIKSVQRLSSDLRPPILDHLGLFNALRQYAAEFQQRSEIKVQTDLPLEELSMHTDTSIAIFRVIQEAFTNVARHAGAENISLRMEVLEDKLHVEIKDDGKGIDPECVESTDSLGIIGMRERITRSNGEFEVTGREGAGTVIRFSVPLD